MKIPDDLAEAWAVCVGNIGARMNSLWNSAWVKTLIERVAGAEERLKQAEAEVTRLRALAEWTLIDKQHLPTVGDEIYARARCRGFLWVTVATVGKHKAHWAAEDYTKNGWTHYRPITPPE